MSTMKLLWKQNKKSVSDVSETINDSLYNVNRKVKKIDNKVDDMDGDEDKKRPRNSPDRVH